MIFAAPESLEFLTSKDNIVFQSMDRQHVMPGLNMSMKVRRQPLTIPLPFTLSWHNNIIVRLFTG